MTARISNPALLIILPMTRNEQVLECHYAWVAGGDRSQSRWWRGNPCTRGPGSRFTAGQVIASLDMIAPPL